MIAPIFLSSNFPVAPSPHSRNKTVYFSGVGSRSNRGLLGSGVVGWIRRERLQVRKERLVRAERVLKLSAIDGRATKIPRPLQGRYKEGRPSGFMATGTNFRKANRATSIGDLLARHKQPAGTAQPFLLAACPAAILVAQLFLKGVSDGVGDAATLGDPLPRHGAVA